MPQLSDTMEEGTLIKWHKKEGDKVTSGEEIADVETDKATMPMEAFDSGTLAYVAVKEGQKARVGQLLAVIATAGEKPEEVKSKAMAAPQSAPATPAPVAQTHSAGPPDVEAAHPKYEQQAEQERTEQVAAPGNDTRRIKASPLARRIAAEHGIDLSQVHGTGPGGRIVEKDVAALTGGAPAPGAAAQVPAPAFAPVPAGQIEVVGMSKMRSAIAAALLRSKQTIPHFYETIDIDMEAVLALRQRLNEQLEKEKVRLSIADFIYKATASALLRHPALNARFNPEKAQISRYPDVNLGIAVSVPDGLIVPVLRGINHMGLKEIRTRSLDLIERARRQRLRREEQTESTFTVTSLGSQGVREFSAIINPPEVAILAIGAAEKRAVVQADQIVARTMMTVTLSADHRVVDGAVAADFLATLKAMLQEPGMMLV